MAYTWIPFYKELAQKLLQFRNDRNPLVEWINTDLKKVRTKSRSWPLIEYLTEKKSHKITDIDPFSVFGIFNRNNIRGESGRNELLLKFRHYFNISSELPLDFEGLPSIDIKSNFYLLSNSKNLTISDLWELYVKILCNENVSDDFDRMISNGVSVQELSLSLYWIVPESFLPLNDLNSKYLQMHGIKTSISNLDYQGYCLIMSKVSEIQSKSFAELTASAIDLANTKRIWMWSGDEETFENNYLSCGSSAEGNINFASISSKKELGEAYRSIKGNNDANLPAAYWDFIKEVKVGDVVVVFSNRIEDKQRYHILYGWGIFISECEFDYQKENPLRRNVQWYSSNSIQKETLSKNHHFFHSVEGIESANIIHLLKIGDVFVNSNSHYSKVQQNAQTKSGNTNVPFKYITRTEPEPIVKSFENYSKERFLKQVFVSQNDYERLESLLLRKKNLILQGAPGVGKTYAAKRLAYAIMSEMNDDRVMQVQFHQNYSYEDFVMGYKPNEEGGFELKNGIFYRFCKRATADSEHKYFFIIDEINRGNLSKIFGELLMLIENDYRDKPIMMAYKDESFAVPANLYIIGMMNTADRSLAMIDYALRRRFSFFEMKPGFTNPVFQEEVSKKKDPQLTNLVNAIIDLNKEIENDDSLGSGFCIGHSYLCNLGDNYNLENIVEYDIIPMLREYWFDNDDKFNQEAQKLRNAL